MRLIHNHRIITSLYAILILVYISFFLQGCGDDILEATGSINYVYPQKGEIDYSTREYELILGDDGFFHDKPTDIGVQNVRKRVEQFLKQSWKALHDVPKYDKGYFDEGRVYTGIPYSFAAESDGIVGFNISLYTFITAISNPFSFIYTVDLREEPFVEILPGPYYGVVCSSAVSYFLGMDFHYVTYLLDSCPWLVRLPEQDPNQIRVGDVIWKKNHVMLVYDIVRDSANHITRVTLAEGNIPLTKSLTLSFEDFQRRWETDLYLIYCYTNIGETSYDSTADDLYEVGDVMGEITSGICTARGDRVCFRKGDNVEINTIKKPRERVVLYKDASYYGEYYSENHSLTIDGLGFGSYTAILDSYDSSNATHFSVLDYSVDAARVSSTSLRVSYHSENATPIYVAFCNSQYRYISVYPLSEIDSNRGFVIIPIEDVDCRDLHIRVFFEGQFGRVSSPLMKAPF